MQTQSKSLITHSQFVFIHSLKLSISIIRRHKCQSVGSTVLEGELKSEPNPEVTGQSFHVAVFTPHHPTECFIYQPVNYKQRYARRFEEVHDIGLSQSHPKLS